MIEHKTVVETLTINRDGSIVVHTVQEFVKDGVVMQTGLNPHAIRINPGADVAEKLAAENTSLALRDVPPITDGWDKVAALAPVVHSKRVVDDFAAKRAEAAAAA